MDNYDSTDTTDFWVRFQRTQEEQTRYLKAIHTEMKKQAEEREKTYKPVRIIAYVYIASMLICFVAAVAAAAK